MPLWAIIPELVLACAVLVLLVIAPFTRDRTTTALYLGAIGVLLVAAAFTARMLPWPDRSIFEGTYRLDPLAHFLKLYAIAGGVLTLLASADYFRDARCRAEVPALLVAATLGAAMLAGSLDMALVVLFFEIVAIATLILVGITTDTPPSNEAALKYFLYGAVAVAVMLFGFSFLYGLTGSTRIDVAVRGWPISVALLALVIAFVGFAFKMAVAPLHMWAPDVYQGAPTPIAGFLAVVPKAAAVAIVLRLLHGSFAPQQVAWRPLMEGLAAASMTVGNLAALRQNNVKRLLAYSSIAQIGYVLVGVSLSATAAGMQAALFYLVVYLTMNLGAFFAAARIEQTFGAVEIEGYAGLWAIAPGLAIAMTLALLSLAGVPPLGGYVGKVLLLAVAVSNGAVWLALLLAANTVLAVYYYLRIIARMYLASAAASETLERRWMADASLAITTALTVTFGVAPDVLIRWLQAAWRTA